MPIAHQPTKPLICLKQNSLQYNCLLASLLHHSNSQEPPRCHRHSSPYNITNTTHYFNSHQSQPFSRTSLQQSPPPQSLATSSLCQSIFHPSATPHNLHSACTQFKHHESPPIQFATSHPLYTTACNYFNTSHHEFPIKLQLSLLLAKQHCQHPHHHTYHTSSIHPSKHSHIASTNNSTSPFLPLIYITNTPSSIISSLPILIEPQPSALHLSYHLNHSLTCTVTHSTLSPVHK